MTKARVVLCFAAAAVVLSSCGSGSDGSGGGAQVTPGKSGSPTPRLSPHSSPEATKTSTSPPAQTAKPAPPAPPKAASSSSVAGKRVLLTGDLTGPREAAVGEMLARGPPIDVLKVAHHGSRYSTTGAFLDDTRPRFAVISVGHNSCGHPAPDTIARLRALGTCIYSTQENGTITLMIAGSGRLSWRSSP